MLNEIDVLDLKKKLNSNEKLILVDIREPYELDICKIQESIHIPMREIPIQFNQFSKDQKLIIQCRSGVRSARICEFLYNKGFHEVQNLKGGILEWIRLVNPSLKSY